MRWGSSVGILGRWPTHRRFPVVRAFFPEMRQATVEPISFAKRLSVGGDLAGRTFFTTWGGFFWTALWALDFKFEVATFVFLFCATAFAFTVFFTAGGLATISRLLVVGLPSPLCSPSPDISSNLIPAVDPSSRGFSSSSNWSSSDNLALATKNAKTDYCLIPQYIFTIEETKKNRWSTVHLERPC